MATTNHEWTDVGTGTIDTPSMEYCRKCGAWKFGYRARYACPGYPRGMTARARVETAKRYASNDNNGG